MVFVPKNKFTQLWIPPSICWASAASACSCNFNPLLLLIIPGSSNFFQEPAFFDVLFLHSKWSIDYPPDRGPPAHPLGQLPLLASGPDQRLPTLLKYQEHSWWTGMRGISQTNTVWGMWYLVSGSSQQLFESILWLKGYFFQFLCPSWSGCFLVFSKFRGINQKLFQQYFRFVFCKSFDQFWVAEYPPYSLISNIQ